VTTSRHSVGSVIPAPGLVLPASSTFQLGGQEETWTDSGKGTPIVTTNHPLLRIAIQRQSPEMIVVSVAGELDLDSSPELQDAITDVVEIHRSASLIMDLEQLTFCDAAGVRTLLGFWQQSRQRNTSMSISRASPPVHRVLAISGVLSILGLQTSAGEPPRESTAYAEDSSGPS
jgi:anti-sigma B factor antagonist